MVAGSAFGNSCVCKSRIVKVNFNDYTHKKASEYMLITNGR